MVVEFLGVFETPLNLRVEWLLSDDLYAKDNS
jgi:hypothetical protein